MIKVVSKLCRVSLHGVGAFNAIDRASAWLKQGKTEVLA